VLLVGPHQRCGPSVGGVIASLAGGAGPSRGRLLFEGRRALARRPFLIHIVLIALCSEEFIDLREAGAIV